MQPESTGVHQDPEQAGPDPSPENKPEVAAPDLDAVAALEDRLRRALADLDNLRKRHARELDRERAAAANRVAAAWLPVLDNLELALSHADDPDHPLVRGIQAIRDQAVDILNRQGFGPVDEVGVPFDPQLHEVVAVVENPDVPPGAVAAVLRPGYGHGERQLRPAMVAVSKRAG